MAKDAGQGLGSQQYFFAATDKSNEFLLRQIKLALESNGFYPVIEGLSVSDHVVTAGSFMLRAEWLKTHPGVLWLFHTERRNGETGRSVSSAR